MSQGFEIKSTSGKKSSLPQLPLREVAEIQDIQQSLVAHFADIKDPRVERTKKHQLTDILAIAFSLSSPERKGGKTSRIMALVKKSG